MCLVINNSNIIKTICMGIFPFLLQQNTKLNQHLFWVAVGVLQLGDSSLFAAGLSLMEACIKVLVDIHVFESQVSERAYTSSPILLLYKVGYFQK